jgi:hypothetical protein
VSVVDRVEMQTLPPHAADSRLGQIVSDLKTHLRISLDRARAGFEDIAGVET